MISKGRSHLMLGKMFILLILVVLCACVSVVAVHAQEYPERVPRLTIQEEYELISTPKQLGDFMADNFTYDEQRWSERDSKPAMTTEQMLRIRKGVCRDFVHFAGEWLDAHGYEPKQIAMRSGQDGHEIVYYQEGHRVCAFNNTHRYCMLTLDGLVYYAMRGSCWYVREWDDTDLIRC